MPPIIVVMLPVFPLSFIYVVVRHRVLGVSLAIRRGLPYALVSRGFLLAEGLAVSLHSTWAWGRCLSGPFPRPALAASPRPMLSPRRLVQSGSAGTAHQARWTGVSSGDP